MFAARKQNLKELYIVPCSVVILVKQIILIRKLKCQNVEKNVLLTDQFIQLSKKAYIRQYYSGYQMVSLLPSNSAAQKPLRWNCIRTAQGDSDWSDLGQGVCQG